MMIRWTLNLLFLVMAVWGLPHEEILDSDNPCIHKPCEHGVCVETAGVGRGYKCFCEDGYTGYNCETDWDECWNSPCLNGGTCHDGIAHFNCTCPTGFSGSRCQVNVDDCLSEPCLNNGTCEDGVDGYSCNCLLGFRGANCEIDIQVCNMTRGEGEARCANGGECIDGLGDSFSCICENGWAGETCEVNVDECEENPCLNGGHCMDLIGDFSCTCSITWTGRLCEERVEQCEDNPCLNGALCLIEDDSFRCYCVPDYHGKRCQYKYNECQLPPGPKCLHGGTCQDDVDDFECSCESGFSGTYCECKDGEEPECIDVNSTWSWTLPPDFVLIDYDDTTDVSTDLEPSISTIIAHASVTVGYDEVTQITADILESSAISDLISPTVTDAKTIVTVGYEEVTHITAEIIEATAIPGQFSSILATPSIHEEGSGLQSSDYRLIEELGIDIDIDESAFPSMSSREWGIFASSDIVGSMDVTQQTRSPGVESPFMSTQQLFSSPFIDPLSSFMPDIDSTSGETYTELISTSEIETQSTPTLVSPTPSLPEETESYGTGTEGIPGITQDTLTSIETEESTKSDKMDEGTVTTDQDFDKIPGSSVAADQTQTTQGNFEDDLTSLVPTTEISTIITETPISDNSTTSGLVMTDSSVTIKITTLQPRTTSDDTEYSFQSNVTSCKNNVCRNGGTCLTSIDGFQCHCRLQYSGRHCEQEVIVKTPGFVGHSYLVHLLNTNNKTVEDGVDIEIKFKTRHSEGILFYSGQEGKMFITSYLQDGILHFKVSCGHQLITFSDPKHRVDNGNTHTLALMVLLNKDTDNGHTCRTVIKLNGTHTMRGEQETYWVPQLPEYIYLGGAPHDMLIFHDADMIIPSYGLRGCVRSFMLDEKELDLFADAVTGQDIIECDSAVCSESPCHNNGVCNQDLTGTSWFCDCLPGFTGPLCERPVCNANPCLHGGTCIGKGDGDGFICLCPFGRRGGICEEEIKLNQPSFTSWVVGYSSFLTYMTPPDVGLYLEAKFHFTTNVVNQVALLMFMGQKGTHRQGSDYLAVSFIKGHVLLTWDLGAGPRRIFTPAPVDERLLVHSVHIGRRGRRGWMKVDHFKNITGLAPGKLADLNVNGEFFIGGHELYNFTRLPHDLPVHTGFTGCIFDLVLKGGDMNPIVPIPQRGRNVQQCHQRMCDREPCQGGYCLDYGASFSCQCPDGRSGPSCDMHHNVCSGGAHQCQEGSTCITNSTGGYSCVCPLGRRGQHCEENVGLSDARFTGDHSYMSVDLMTAVRFNTHVILEIKPENSDGLILHLSQRTNQFGDFLSLLLVNGTLFFTYSLGSDESVTTIRAPCCIELNTWHTISAGRYGNQGYLQLDETFMKGQSTEGLLTLDVSPTIYLGGLPDMSAISEKSIEGKSSRFKGCLRNLHINENAYPLRVMSGRQGANIVDCDGTVCGGEVCQNDGVCVLDKDTSVGYHCECQNRYTGNHCQLHTLCQNSPCKNKAKCKVFNGKHDFFCDCPLGYQGKTCDSRIDVEVPHFGGQSYLQYELPDISTVRYSTEIEMDIYLDKNNGMLVWIGIDPTADDYLGVGLEDGLLKVVWNLGWFSRTELTIPDRNLTDDSWHKVHIKRMRQQMDILLDELSYISQVHGTYHELNTINKVNFGSAQNDVLVEDLTRGHFREGFAGCMREIKVQGIPIDTTSGYHLLGQNINECADRRK